MKRTVVAQCVRLDNDILEQLEQFVLLAWCVNSTALTEEGHPIRVPSESVESCYWILFFLIRVLMLVSSEREWNGK
jgi:hypothetical protein